MPNSDLQDNLVDDLVPVADELRGDLYQSMGIRQHNVHLVRRRWSGTERGEGTVTVLSNVLISPPPLFTLPNTQGAEHWEMSPDGRDPQGMALLTEVSLTYSEAELTGGIIAKNEEFYYRVSDSRGQGVATEYYVPSARPRTDREKNLGWEIQLRRIGDRQE